MSQAVVIWVAPNGGSVNEIHVLDEADAAQKALDIVTNLGDDAGMSADDIVSALDADGNVVVYSDPDNRIEVWMAVP
jgi:hypothetical protein